MLKNQAEVLLWRSVIDQAFFDAFATPQNEKDKEDIREAKEWLENKPEDMILVCKCADVDPDFVTKVYERAKEHNFNYERILR